MGKFNKLTAIFIIFLTFIVIYGLWQIPIINIITQAQEVKVSGFFINFENGTTEPEVKAILENHNMTVNYTIDYNTNYTAAEYYIKVGKDKRIDIINESMKYKNLTSEIELKKGNYSIFLLSNEFIQDEDFLAILEENNIKLKKSVICYIIFRDRSGNYTLGKNCITWSDAIKLKNELETDEKILTATPIDIKR